MIDEYDPEHEQLTEVSVMMGDEEVGTVTVSGDVSTATTNVSWDDITWNTGSSDTELLSTAQYTHD